MSIPSSPTSPNENPQFTPIKEEQKKIKSTEKVVPKEDELPPELIREIFSFGTSHPEVSHSWRSVTVENQEKPAKDLVKCLMKSLDANKYPEQLKKCDELLEKINKKIHNCFTVMSLKKEMVGLRQQLVAMLRSVDETEWGVINKHLEEHFKSHQAPIGFSNLVELAWCERQLETLETINKGDKTNTLSVCVLALCRGDQRARALKIAHTIPNETIRERVVVNVIENAIKNDGLDQALKEANTILDEDAKSKAFSKIAEAFIKEGALPKALELTKKMESWDSRTIIKSIADIMKSNCQKLLKDNKIDEAIKQALTIPSKEEKAEMLIEILRERSDVWKVEKMWSLAQEVPKGAIIDGAWGHIVAYKIVLDAINANTDKKLILEIAKAIPQGENRTGGVFIKMFSKIADLNPELALEIYEMVRKDERSAAMSYVARGFAGKGKFEQSYQLCAKVDDEYYRGLAIKDLINKISKVDLDQAVEFGLKLPESTEKQVDMKTKALAQVAINLAEHDIEKALVLAEKIPGSKGKVYEYLISKLIDLKEGERAYPLLDKIKPEQYKAWVIIPAVNKLLNNSDLKWASKFTALLPDEFHKDKARLFERIKNTQA